LAKRYFSKAHIAKLRAELADVEHKTNDLLLSYTYYPWNTDRGREYARHGFARRLGTLRRAVLNVFKIIPPGTVRVPSRDRLYDAQINIQAFIANVYGCIDNLAWVWVYENGLDKTIHRKHVGFRKTNTKVRESLQPAFRRYLEERDDWIDYIIDYRDALAHRIPLYIPPGGVPKSKHDEFYDYDRRMQEVMFDPAEYNRLEAEQSKLLLFQPVMTHSFVEARHLPPFHNQLVIDFLTIEELSTKFLRELKASRLPPSRAPRRYRLPGA